MTMHNKYLERVMHNDGHFITVMYDERSYGYTDDNVIGDQPHTVVKALPMVWNVRPTSKVNLILYCTVPYVLRSGRCCIGPLSLAN